MKRILVPIKRVPDPDIKPRVADDGAKIRSEGLKWIINPFDEIAIEEAVRIKEQYPSVEIVVVSIGSLDTISELRFALSIGADSGLLIVANNYIDSDSASAYLAQIVKTRNFDLVIMGKQSIDSDAHQCAELLAYRLGWVQATCVSELKFVDNLLSAEVSREVDQGIEKLQITLPAVISADLRLNEPRYPSLPNIIKAKKKEIETIPIEQFEGKIKPKLKTVRLSPSPEKCAGIRVSSVEELVAEIKNTLNVNSSF